MSFEIDRRNLLRTGAVLGAALALDGCKDDEEKPSANASARPSPAAETDTLDVLAAVAERILPSEGDGPGAKEANVRGFLEKALSDPRLAHLRPLLERGAAFLDEAARVERKAAGFVALPNDERDDLLTRLAERKMRPNGFDGTAFVRIMLALTLEGFLGDPKHGGNQDGVAWAWLGFDPKGRNAGAHKGGRE